jgi:hypothetical protein
MWTVLAPLLIFVVVLLFQLGKQKENFQTDASGNVLDASGNVIDASGSPVTPSPANIQLTFSDLLKLFKASTPAIETKTPSIKEAIQEVVAKTPETPTQLYEKLRPSVLLDIKSQLQGAPFEPAAPIPSSAGCDMSSDAIAQGVEMMDAKTSLENNAEYIRKDSIPCYACSL